MLRVRNLSKRFGDRVVLRGISFHVAPGEVFALIGGNGAGKSTTVNIIAGTLVPDAGDISAEGCGSADHWRSRMGVAMQEAALYPALTSEEHLRLFGRLFGLRGSELRHQIDRTVERTDLAEYRYARAADLSGGWRRRLNLAVALVHRPRLLLLDEPTAGLDVDAREGVWRLIEDLRREGVMVVVTTHLLDEVEAHCDRAAILSNGLIAAQGTMAQLYSIVPAQEVAVLEGGDVERIRNRARTLGIEVREYAGRPSLLLPEQSTVKSLIDRLGELECRSIRLEPVSLHHVSLELRDADSMN